MVERVPLGGPRGGGPGIMDPRVLSVAAVMLLIAALVISPATADEGSGGSSGTVSMHLEVANAVPENIRWDVAHEQYLGFYTFNVSARDNNGVDDLDRFVLLLVDANGVETRHETDEGQRLNATTGIWLGHVWAEARPIATPVQVEIKVHDRAGGVTFESGQGRPLAPWPSRAPRMPETPVEPAEGGSLPGGASPSGKGPGSTLEPLYASAAGIHKSGSDLITDLDLPGLFWGLFTGLVSALLFVVGRRPSRPPLPRGRSRPDRARSDQNR